MSEFQKLLIEQLESSVDFLRFERDKHKKGDPEYHQLNKELAQAEVSLNRERIK